MDINNLVHEWNNFFSQPNAYRSLLILLAAIVVAYFLSKYIAVAFVKLAQIVSGHAERAVTDEQVIRLRQIETYLSVTVAIIRAVFVAIIGYLIWRWVSPTSSSGIAAIGAGTVFVVVAGQTIAPILRDLTMGAIMIGEGWFTVGDFISIEPFGNVSGVVERFTLRSTKLRSLNGEIIWIHNQQIMSVHVTPRGVRTISVDVFVHDKEKGLRALKRLAKAIPVGPTMLATPMVIGKPEEWGDDNWRITVIGQTLPGREWLIERFFVGAIEDIDADKPRGERTFVFAPIARYTDPAADRRLKRVVRARREAPKE